MRLAIYRRYSEDARGYYSAICMRWKYLFSKIRLSCFTFFTLQNVFSPFMKLSFTLELKKVKQPCMYLSLSCFSCDLSYTKDMEHTRSEIGPDESVTYEKETLLHIEVGSGELCYLY